MKKSYEVTREIFNRCSNNQMRDVFISEEELDDGDIDAMIRKYTAGGGVKFEKYVDGRGTITVDIDNNGIREKLTFCP